jgi:hypothetical protein
VIAAWDARLAAVSAVLVAAGCAVEDAHDPDADLRIVLDGCEWWLSLSVAERYAAEIVAGEDALTVLGDSDYREM